MRYLMVYDDNFYNTLIINSCQFYSYHQYCAIMYGNFMIRPDKIEYGCCDVFEKKWYARLNACKIKNTVAAYKNIVAEYKESFEYIKNTILNLGSYYRIAK